MEQRVIREVGLDQYHPWFLGASGASGHLHQLRKQTFRRPEIRAEQGTIRVDHPDQRQVGEVVPLGDHLGADEDVDLAPRDARQDGLGLGAGGDRRSPGRLSRR